MNRFNANHGGCSHWGVSTATAKSNGNGIVMEWVGYPFATAMAMASS